jgi:antitoxin ParD1/3/4
VGQLLYYTQVFVKEALEMAEGVNVRITGKLRRFIEEQASPNGLYESASEYVRDLIRRDYQRQEERKWSWLMDQLRPGMEADESDFVPLDPEEIIKAAKKEKAGNAS